MEQRSEDGHIGDGRRAALEAAQERGMALFSAIEKGGLVAAGRTEHDVEQDIYALARDRFGVEKHWHKRIVRAGPNTLTIFSDNPPDRVIQADDTVYLDLGPVFQTWEADIGRTYALGNNPEKRRLVADLERSFVRVQDHFHSSPDITGAELFAYAQSVATQAGWDFGGIMAGHIIGEFAHALIPGDKDLYRISPNNPTRMRDPDANGHEKHWILEIHLVDRARTFGGFYERLL
jgi:Xaa-Pro dipeptidase